jgi:hypothetical protein
MKSTYRETMRAARSAVVHWIFGRVTAIGRALLQVGEQQSRREEEPHPQPAEQARSAPATDERSGRRRGEEARGGISSQEATQRWERGENPGGLHHKATRHPGEEDDTAMERDPVREEPEGRKERQPGGERHMAETRRGG